VLKGGATRRLVVAAALLPFAGIACGHSDDGQGGREALPNELPREKIVYAHGHEIFVVSPDGTGVRQLTGDTETYESSPAWSPDGRLIAYVRTPRAPWEPNVPPAEELYVMNADGSDERRLTRNSAEELTPRWLPDGRIVFVSCPPRPGLEQRDCSLVAMGADGTGSTVLARLGSAVGLDVSPHGGGIVYVEIEGQSHYQEFELVVMNLDGTGRNELTDNNTGDSAPAWSPDGARIAFMSNRAESAPCDSHDCVGFTNELYVMDADGSDVTRLTETPNEEAGPRWSPDGEKIVFVRQGHVHPELYVMNADGTCPRRLGEGTEPDWDGTAAAEDGLTETLRPFLDALRRVTC
jgi:Tol biopolymer transport system component